MAQQTRPTIRSIATALNISPGTVSRSLRETPGVHPEMRKRVRAMAQSMGYIGRADASAKERAVAQRTRVGVVVGDRVVLSGEGTVDTTYVAYHFLAGISQAASDLGALMSIDFVNATTLDPQSDPQREIGFLGHVDGVILIYPLPEPFVGRLVQHTNVVSIEHAYPSLAVDVVGPAHAVDVMRAVEKLHELGHRRIGYTADEASRGYRFPQGQRFGGYLTGLRRVGIEYRQEDVIGIPGPSVARTELAKLVAARIRDGVTGVVCSTDRQAYALRRELSGSGISVPGEVSIIGFGGVTPLEGAPHITMFRTPDATLGLAAMSRLQERIERPHTSSVLSEFPGTFIEGSSIASPRKG
jgi:DNA-binding LacI/PurR family transcriptional regulator